MLAIISGLLNMVWLRLLIRRPRLPGEQGDFRRVRRGVLVHGAESVRGAREQGELRGTRDVATRRWQARRMPEATGEQEVASPLGAGGEGLHALCAHGIRQRLRQPFRGLDQLRRQGCVFRLASDLSLIHI